MKDKKTKKAIEAECKGCHVTFTRRKDLGRHACKESGYLVFCSHGLTFPNIRERNKSGHPADVHCNVALYKCKFCDKIYKGRKGARRHVVNDHSH